MIGLTDLFASRAIHSKEFRCSQQQRRCSVCRFRHRRRSANVIPCELRIDEATRELVNRCDGTVTTARLVDQMCSYFGAERPQLREEVATKVCSALDDLYQKGVLVFGEYGGGLGMDRGNKGQRAELHTVPDSEQRIAGSWPFEVPGMSKRLVLGLGRHAGTEVAGTGAAGAKINRWCWQEGRRAGGLFFRHRDWVGLIRRRVRAAEVAREKAWRPILCAAGTYQQVSRW